LSDCYLLGRHMFWRKIVVRGLVAAVVAVSLGFGVVYQQWTNPEAVRQQVVDMLRQQFPGAEVTLDNARLQLFGSVVLTDLRLLRRGQGEANECLYVPMATVYHNKELLMQAQFAVRRIELKGPRIRIVRDHHGEWNIDGLTGQTDAAAPLPTIVIVNGTLIFEDHLAGPVSWELHHVQLTLINDSPGSLSFNGSAISETLGNVSVVGSLNRAARSAAISIRTTDLNITHEMVRYLRSQVPHPKWEGLRLEGKADMRAELTYNALAVPAFKHDLKLQLKQMRVEHPELPVPLQNLNAQLQCDGTRLILQKLEATADGVGRLEAKGWAALPDFQENFTGEFTATHLPISEKLVERLAAFSPGVKEIHDLFRPQGYGKAAVKVERKDGQWQSLCCQLEPDGVGVNFVKFPYPLAGIRGKIECDLLHKDHTFDLVGYSGPHAINIKGNWHGADKNVVALIELSGQDIPLDKKLLDALSKPNQDLARSFAPTGRGNFRGVVRRVRGTKEFFGTYQMHFVDCSAKWTEFPYLLEHVEGDLTIHPEPGRFDFANFKGYHGGATIQIWGSREPEVEGKSDSHLLVHVTGQNVLLDGALRDALASTPPGAAGAAKTWNAAETWKALEPSGAVQFQATVEQVGKQAHDLDLTVDVARCRMKLKCFPYALEDVTGLVHYRANQVELTRFTASHGASRFGAENGSIDLYPGGGYHLKVPNLIANPVIADADLVRAMSEYLQKTVKAINLIDQPLALQTNLVVSQSGEQGTKPEIFWDGVMWLHDAVLHAGVELDHVNGAIGCRGLSRGDKLVGLVGNVYLDEASVFKQPLRGARGHFSIDDKSSDVVRFAMQSPLFGGDITGHGKLELGSSPRYEVDMTAAQIRLEEFGRHNLGANHELAGLAAGRLHLHGVVPEKGNAFDGLEGNGSLDVPYTTQTRLLNLPLLLDLLKFLGLRLPDRTAFEEAHAVFAIQGQRVGISRLELMGNAVSVYGKGEVNLDGSNLLLELYPSWGRAEQMLPSVVRSIPSAISKQLMKIEMRGRVGGQADDIKFKGIPVPALTEPIMQMHDRLIGQPETKTP
jgi:hypothetical protein